ncbi:MAG: YkgJ family cysteine cluster protein [Clostridia bacterium]|nr:YkgJ family cysteine cluster protein [Clostridia bacterium]
MNEQKSGVLVRRWPPGGGGYDVVIVDAEATVADYLRALEPLAGDQGLRRARNPGGTCYACPRCCAERIPLTSIDVRELAAATAAGEGRGHAGRPDALAQAGGEARLLLEVVRRYAWVSVMGRAVDVSLRRGEDGACLLLDAGRGLCRYYASRPLVCRTYFCCPASRRARILRERIVNQGQDELVRLLLEETGTAMFPFNEADAPRLCAGDWRENGFSGRRTYAEVRLREVLPRRWWRQFYGAGPSGEGARGG